jgi:hypothetical protein
MKKRYTYYPEFNNTHDLLWLVYEEPTSQVVAEFFFEDDAQAYCEFLDSGGGFSGFTPSFMVRKINAGNINDAFSMEFS